MNLQRSFDRACSFGYNCASSSLGGFAQNNPGHAAFESGSSINGIEEEKRRPQSLFWQARREVQGRQGQDKAKMGAKKAPVVAKAQGHQAGGEGQAGRQGRPGEAGRKASPRSESRGGRSP